MNGHRSVLIRDNHCPLMIGVDKVNRHLLTLAVFVVGFTWTTGCESNKQAIGTNHQYLVGQKKHASEKVDLPPVPEVLPETHFAAGQLFEKQAAPYKAIGQYEKALAKDPDHVPSLARLGELYGYFGHHVRAEVALRHAVELKPDNAYLRNNLGFEYVLQARWEDAEKEFCKAIQLKKDFRRAHINLGMTQAKLKEFDQALATFKSVLPNADAYYNLGLMYQADKQYISAADAYNRALEFDSKFVAAQKQLDVIGPQLLLLPVETETVEEEAQRLAVMDVIDEMESIDFSKMDVEPDAVSPPVVQNLQGYEPPQVDEPVAVEIDEPLNEVVSENTNVPKPDEVLPEAFREEELVVVAVVEEGEPEDAVSVVATDSKTLDKPEPVEGEIGESFESTTAVESKEVEPAQAVLPEAFYKALVEQRSFPGWLEADVEFDLDKVTEVAEVSKEDSRDIGNTEPIKNPVADTFESELAAVESNLPEKVIDEFAELNVIWPVARGNERHVVEAVKKPVRKYRDWFYKNAGGKAATAQRNVLVEMGGRTDESSEAVRDELKTAHSDRSADSSVPTVKPEKEYVAENPVAAIESFNDDIPCDLRKLTLEDFVPEKIAAVIKLGKKVELPIDLNDNNGEQLPVLPNVNWQALNGDQLEKAADIAHSFDPELRELQADLIQNHLQIMWGRFDQSLEPLATVQSNSAIDLNRTNTIADISLLTGQAATDAGDRSSLEWDNQNFEMIPIEDELRYEAFSADWEK